ncbi:MAG TPA: AraC family transcriptional regulator ligand-binding domain-containing protein [Anaeromyxobacteraceae bacterium]|nr:AraC family transcriptional regulator ligand-binding domain-containing protein [Anaeromyxobacteraceae bacterium]
MSETKSVTLERAWGVALRDLSVEPQNVLRRARLPVDLLGQDPARVTVPEYFALFDALQAEAGDPTFAIRLGSAVTPQAFHPLIFAALCCADLATAVRRIDDYKRLIAPVRIITEQDEKGLVVGWEWNDPTLRPPLLLVATDLVFLVHLARIGAREPITPVRVTSTAPLEPSEPFEQFFGVRPSVADRHGLTFRPEDATRPFLTASESMWAMFEPGLQRRLSKLEALAPLPERVRSVLLDCLPSGESSIDEVARRLGMSPRTLQRQLADHGVSYRDLVKTTRLNLVQHYLGNTMLSYAEISFLVGFDEPSSFFRAFREWTGTTPEAARQARAVRG